MGEDEVSWVSSFPLNSAHSPAGPTLVPQSPSVPALHLLDGIVADEVHRLVPGAAPDTDAATGVDGTAQPIGGCPHHLRKVQDREAVSSSQWGPGCPGGGRPPDLLQGGCMKWGLPDPRWGGWKHIALCFSNFLLLQPAVRNEFYIVTLGGCQYTHKIRTKVLWTNIFKLITHEIC